MIRQEIEKALQAALKDLGVETSFVLERPAMMEHGDYATNAALIAAKILKKSPREVAELLKAKFVLQNGLAEQSEETRGPFAEGILLQGIEKIEVAGAGFINFFVSRRILSDVVQTVIDTGDAWGSTTRSMSEKWLIEHTSPNPNKAMHIGHLRNNVTGMAIANIAEFSGVSVVRDCIDNNRGIAIAKLMWGYLKFARQDGAQNVDVNYWYQHEDEWQTPEELSVRPDRFVDALYVQGSDDFEKNPDVEKQVRQLVVDWEKGDEKVLKLWKKVLGYSYAGQEMTLKRLGNKWDMVWHEHEHYQKGKDLVEEGLKKEIFKKLDDGAVLTNLESYGLPDTIVMKSDGTSLYITQDLALTKLKREKCNPDKLFWVIGPEQSLALKQLFAVCEQLGLGKYTDYTHISYGYMSLKGEGKMSSRKGNVLYIDDLIDQVKESVQNLLHESEFTSEKKDELAEQVAVGAVKFGILKAGRTTDIAFDIKTATDLHGDTGPYVQYTHARTRSLVEKARAQGVETKKDAGLVNNVTRLLLHFPDVIERASRDLEPHQIASFLLELSSAFNAWYGQEQILDGTPEASSKIALVEAVRITLKNGLTLLGISAPEKM